MEEGEISAEEGEISNVDGPIPLRELFIKKEDVPKIKQISYTPKFNYKSDECDWKGKRKYNFSIQLKKEHNKIEERRLHNCRCITNESEIHFAFK